MPTAADLYYFVHGVELKDNLPILLIHGAGGHHLTWPPQIRRLSDHRIIALDLPGHGKSGGVGKQNILEYAQSVVGFMKATRSSPAVICGFSMGSAIALSLALKYPKRVVGLGLIGGGAKMRVAPEIIEMASSETTYRSAVQKMVDGSYSASANIRLKDLAFEQMGETRHTVFYGDLLACDSFNVMERVKNIKVPTTLICGSEDRMTPSNRSEYLRGQIRGSQLHVLDGAGHMVMQERPEEVAGILSTFLEKL